jgi:hypothetical protein
MSYDEGRYQTKKVYPMIKATFAGGLLGTTATNTGVQTSAEVSDRIEFFSNIKLIGMKIQPEVAPDAGAHNTSMTIKYVLTDGSTEYASGAVGTVAGVNVDGIILSSDIDADAALRIDAQVSDWDGTVQTMAPGSGWVTLEYQERFS